MGIKSRRHICCTTQNVFHLKTQQSDCYLTNGALGNVGKPSYVYSAESTDVLCLPKTQALT